MTAELSKQLENRASVIYKIALWCPEGHRWIKNIGAGFGTSLQELFESLPHRWCPKTVGVDWRHFSMKFCGRPLSPEGILEIRAVDDEHPFQID